MAEQTLPAEIREALDKIERAERMVSSLCEGERRWTMSVPARPNDDPDLVIGDGLNAGRQAIEALVRERDEALERAEAAERALEKDPETRERHNGLPDDWIRAARNVEGEDGE